LFAVDGDKADYEGLNEIEDLVEMSPSRNFILNFCADSLGLFPVYDLLYCLGESLVYEPFSRKKDGFLTILKRKDGHGMILIDTIEEVGTNKL